MLLMLIFLTGRKIKPDYPIQCENSNLLKQAFLTPQPRLEAAAIDHHSLMEGVFILS